MTPTVAIIGAGLAGSEAALVCARHGVDVEVFEMRPGRMTPAHTTGLPAELVCSNSFKAQGTLSAHSLLKDELDILESPLLRLARACAVAAGSALAVDRMQFASAVLGALESCPRITLTRGEVAGPVTGRALTVIAAGPLASQALTDWLSATFSAKSLFFYDAIAPIVSARSVDMHIAFFAERGNPESTDYVNCPFSADEYRRFYDELVRADQVEARAFEDAAFFEACLPVEVLARRGFRALSFGPLKPVDLVDPRTGTRPFAVCQLRRENRAGDSYNLVGFQTRLRIAEQGRVFRLIPGLQNAEFLRWGSIHRNTYLDSPRLLSADFSFKTMPVVFCAGQICGSEGYTESIATGHLAALFACARLRGVPLEAPPAVTALGALARHVTGSEAKVFAPSNINFGLLPSIDGPHGKRLRHEEKHRLLCERAKTELRRWCDGPLRNAVPAPSGETMH